MEDSGGWVGVPLSTIYVIHFIDSTREYLFLLVTPTYLVSALEEFVNIIVTNFCSILFQKVTN